MRKWEMGKLEVRKVLGRRRELIRLAEALAALFDIIGSTEASKLNEAMTGSLFWEGLTITSSDGSIDLILLLNTSVQHIAFTSFIIMGSSQSIPLVSSEVAVTGVILFVGAFLFRSGTVAGNQSREVSSASQRKSSKS